MLRRLAFLNFDAGKKSMSLSAFTSALSYLEATARLVGEDGWDRNYRLCVEAFSLAAEAAYCTGSLDRLHHYVDTVLQHGIDIQDKFRVYDALIASLGSEAKYTEAVDTGLLALEQLGIQLPKYPSKARVVFELLKTRKLLKPFSQQDLESLPVMTDKTRMRASRIMDKIGTYCYFVRQNLLAVVILHMVQWSIRYGICKNSASGFIAYGMIMASHFCDLKGAYMFGQLGFRIVDRLGAKEMKTRVDFLATAFINHWTKPAAQGVKPLLSAFRDGLAKTGDIENCMWCLQYAQGFMIESGQKLSLVHASYKTHKDIIVSAKKLSGYSLFHGGSTYRILWAFQKIRFA